MAATDPHGSAGTPVSVLLVDDEPLVRLFCAEILEDEGSAILEAGSADEALQVLEARTDVLILFSDINMPGPDGLELARRVHDRWPAIAVALTSGTAQVGPDEVSRGGRFIPKPYGRDIVVATMRALAAPPRQGVRTAMGTDVRG